MLKKLSHNFLKVTLPVHGLFLISLFVIPRFGEFFHFFSFLLLWVLISGFGMAVGYHRLLSHRSFECHNAVKRLLAFFGALAGQGSPIFWVATHRGLHHAYSDSLKDPHTPCKGAWNSFIGWQMNFSDADFSVRHCVDILRDPFLKFLSIQYYRIYWVVLGVCLLVSWKFFFCALLPALVLGIHQENIVNLVSHTPGFGYRNFQTEDNSNNSQSLAFFTWGQALHNNHHKFPNRFDFACKESEFDPAATLIRLFIPVPKKKLTKSLVRRNT